MANADKDFMIQPAELPDVFRRFRKSMMRAILIGIVTLSVIGPTHWAQAQRPAPTPSSWKEFKPKKLAPIDRSSVSGEGPQPVIIIAELGCDENTYSEFAKRHAERFTTHTVVLPGSVPGSAAPPLDRGQILDPEWLVNAADAIREYAGQHKIEKPIVIGQGAGGMVAYMLAIRDPDFARGYAIINTLPAPSIGGPGRIPLPEQRSAQVDKLERNTILSMTQSTWANRAQSLLPLQTTDPKRVESMLPMIAAAPISAVRRYSLEPLYLDLREDLNDTQSPILIYATLPSWVRENDRAMLIAAFRNAGYNHPNVRVELVDGARSWFILDEPERFDTPMLTFFGFQPRPEPAKSDAPAEAEKK
ncbi:MAG: alpha/beta hydrolase [Phycisphaeraceae bacterium]|nr:alpha/beta hydrolase [Phycisphaeraceae bacterium]